MRSNCNDVQDVQVSVVVPTYKRPTLVVKCVRALINQVFLQGNYEIIIVSDGPDDDTKGIIELLIHEGHPFIQYIALPKKAGPSAARNAGWRHAKGELIAFTDDDCIPDPLWVKHLWTAYQSQRKNVIAFAGKLIVPISGQPTDYEKNTAYLETAEFITANCACTKNALTHIAGFDETFTLAWREDSDLQFKLIKANVPIVMAPDAIVTHPVREARWGVSLKEQKKSMFNALLFKKHPQLYRSKIQKEPPWHYYAIVLSCLAFLLGIFSGSVGVIIISLASWLTLTTWFILKRLHSTSPNWSHTIEMIVTSLFIPFLSVYWRLYGALKFRVLFL